MERKRSPFRSAALLLVIAALALPLLVMSCGSEYDKPGYQTTGVLIEPATLKAWIDAGKVNGTGYDRVVILDVANSLADYTTTAPGHIAGAVYVNRNEFTIQRTEGLAPAVSMVSDGAKMDEIIRRSGIDKNTTIVFTTRSNYFFAARAYFAFRYWGFPKERLKFLNGVNAEFNTQYPSYMTYSIPTVTPSTYSVAENSALRPDLRSSLGEAIQALGRTDTQFVDMRGGGAGTYYDGTTSTSVTFTLASGSPPSALPTVFKGHIRGAVALSTSAFITGTKFQSAADLQATLTSAGLTSGKRTYTYCTAGIQASSLFFVLDAILGWPVELYDGSWTQWGLYATAANGGKLANGSAWDTTGLSESGSAAPYGPPVYDTAPYADFTTALGYSTDPAVFYITPSDGRANQIELEDAAYIGTGGSSGGSGGGISPGC